MNAVVAAKRLAINDAIAANVRENLRRARAGDEVVLARRPGADPCPIAFLLVRRSTREPGRWQLSWLGHGGSGLVPMGHDTLDSKEDAVRSGSGGCVRGRPPHGSRDYAVVRTLRGEGGRVVVKEFEISEAMIP